MLMEKHRAHEYVINDCIYLELGVHFPKMEKVVRIAREVGREIATPDEARSILSLNPAYKDRILNLSSQL